jgi:hypothetical protein
VRDWHARLVGLGVAAGLMVVGLAVLIVLARRLLLEAWPRTPALLERLLGPARTESTRHHGTVG